MPEVAADTTGWPVPAGEVSDPGTLPAPPGEASDSSPGCTCCGGGPCAFMPCPTWPPDHFDVTFSGIVAPDPCCNDVFVFSTFLYSYSVSYEEDCLNRTFSVPHVPTRADLVNACRWDYRWSCDIAIFDDPHWHAGIDAVIVADGTGVTITAVVSVMPRSFQHNPSDWTCGWLRYYKSTYTAEEFPCAGPWELDPDPELSPANQNEGWTGLPDTLTLTPSFGGAPPEGTSTDCCGLTVTNCKPYVCDTGTCQKLDRVDGTYAGTYETYTACTDAPCGVTHSFDCVDDECVDVGAGGDFATPEECADSGCGVTPPSSTYECVGGVCVDTGSGTMTFVECTSAGVCPPGDNPFAPCCRNDPPNDFFLGITSDCSCVANAEIDMVFDPGAAAYVHNFADCQVRVFCFEGTIYVELICLTTDTVIAGPAALDGSGGATTSISEGGGCCGGNLITFYTVGGALICQ